MSIDGINDDFLMDIPLPEDAEGNPEVIEDECNAAIQYAFIGAGQAGGRMVEAFYKLGYRKVCAVNTTAHDLASLEIPEANKLVLGDDGGGAGKDAEKGREAAEGHSEELYDLMRRCFGKEFDRVLVCAGAGGGTGTGTCLKIIEVAQEIAKTLKIQESGGDPVVGTMVSLPMVSEGQKVNANAAALLNDLLNLAGPRKGRRVTVRQLSPLILVDNERLRQMYPNLPVTKFWGVANNSISGIFHLFNMVSAQDSDYTTFDKADLEDVLKSGVITFGACPLKKWDSATYISVAIRNNLKRTVLVSGLDTAQSEKAACVFVASKDVLDEVPQDYLEHGFEMLSRIMADSATIHRGIYEGSRAGLVAYTMLGELGCPIERITEIAVTGDYWPSILGRKSK